MSFQAAKPHQNLHAWKNIGAADYVIEWFRNGIQLPFINGQPCFELQNYNLKDIERKFITEELQSLLLAGAIRKTTSRPCCVSPLKCTPKKSGGFRLIIDLRQLNECLDVPKFQYESIDTVCDLVEPKDNIFTFDLKHGFYHIPVHVNSQQFLGFTWNNVYYVWCVYPFGCSASPYYFNKCLRPVVTYLRDQGVKIALYVDDFVLLSADSVSTDHVDLVVHTLDDLGLVINVNKSDLTVSKRKEYIGYIIDTDGPEGIPWIYIPEKRIKRLKKDIRRWLNSGQLGARQVASIIGQCSAMCRSVIPGKLKLRSLHRLLATKQNWCDKITLDFDGEDCLYWWLQAIDNWNGCPVKVATIDTQIFCDSSNIGWGAVLIDGELEASGAWSREESSLHINMKEMLAIQYSLLSFAPQIQGKVIQYMSDSVTTVAYIANMGGPIKHLSDLAEQIWATSIAMGVTLKILHLAGSLNDWADMLSRLPTHYEWMLHPNLFQLLEETWGPHSIDRFATHITTQLPCYNSRFHDPYTHGVDALAQADWSYHNNYVNPPFRLLNKVIDVIVKHHAVATIIAPWWRGHRFLHRLQALSMTTPIPLPVSRQTLVLMGPQAEPLKNPKWRLYAWRICG